MSHPFIISQKLGANAIDGLAFVPTIEPAHSDRVDYYPEQWSPKGRKDLDVSKKNKFILAKELHDAKRIVEIGVHDAGTFLMREKNRNAVYLGIDTQDRSSLNDYRRLIYTLQIDSREIKYVCIILDNVLKKIGFERGDLNIDLLFIDGFHSVTQCINDWMYSSLVAPGGVVILHDTNYHPGPIALFEAIDERLWEKEKLCLDPDDYGIAVIRRRT